MANRQKGEIRFDVQGKTYTLVLNTSVMATLEDHFSTPENDVTWDVIWMRVLRGSVKTVRALIWAMLQQYHPTMTLEAAGRLIDDAGGFEGLTHILKQAATSSTPDPKDVKELVPTGPRTAQKTRRGTGGGSTSTRGASV
jgi:hypothetical protein